MSVSIALFSTVASFTITGSSPFISDCSLLAPHFANAKAAIVIISSGEEEINFSISEVFDV